MQRTQVWVDTQRLVTLLECKQTALPIAHKKWHTLDPPPKNPFLFISPRGAISAAKVVAVFHVLLCSFFYPLAFNHSLEHLYAFILPHQVRKNCIPGTYGEKEEYCHIFRILALTWHQSISTCDIPNEASGDSHPYLLPFSLLTNYPDTHILSCMYNMKSM